MGTATEARLARIRGRAVPRSHNARTIAALASNPGCARRALLDAAGVDKQRLAAHAGYRAPFGQSRFALARGNAFEAQLKAEGAAQILTLLRESLNLPVDQAHYHDISDVGGNGSPELRYARTRSLLTGPDVHGTMFDHPLLRLEVGGRHAFLEPDLIAFQVGSAFRVIEIKSFAVIDGQADAEKVAGAAIQSAVYVLALRDLLGNPGAVHHETILICPENFSNRPVAARLDVRKQLTVLRRQLSRLARIDDLLDALPPGLTFDLDPDDQGTPRRDPDDLASALGRVDARYAPECLATCEMCYFCRAEGANHTARLGKTALEELGGIDHVASVLRLARGSQEPGPEQAEAAAMLRRAHALRVGILGGPGSATLGEAV